MATPLPVDRSRQRRLRLRSGRGGVVAFGLRWMAVSAMAAWIVVAGVAAMVRSAD